MKKAIIAAVAVVLIAAAVFALVIIKKLSSPGYNAFWGWRSYDYSGECFIYDPEAGEFLEPSSLEVKAKLCGNETVSDAVFCIPGLVEAADGYKGYAAYGGNGELFYRLVRTDLSGEGAGFTRGAEAVLADMGSGCAIVRIDAADGSELWALYGYADEDSALAALTGFTAR